MSGGVAIKKSGPAGLFDRRCRPHRSPNKTKAAVERRIVALRRSRGLGPARIAGIVGMHASTVHRVLVRHGLSRLSDPGPDDQRADPSHRDDPTGRARPRRHQETGPDSRGWRLARQRPRGRTGTLAQDQGRICLRPFSRRWLHPTGLLRGAQRRTGSDRGGVLADEPTPSSPPMASTSKGSSLTTAACYRSRDFSQSSRRRSRTPSPGPIGPQTNGKVERFNRTMLGEWAYVRAWTSEAQRHQAACHWLHIYNHHRHHTAIGGPPISRVGNLSGHYI